jgi:hypothetical protein
MQGGYKLSIRKQLNSSKLDQIKTFFFKFMRWMETYDLGAKTPKGDIE